MLEQDSKYDSHRLCHSHLATSSSGYPVDSSTDYSPLANDVFSRSFDSSTEMLFPKACFINVDRR
jgi:hypothetical protein